MYKSPVEIIMEDFVKKAEEEAYSFVRSCGIEVDKAELIRALKYDRQQYEKGYADAMASIVRCKDCKNRGSALCPMETVELYPWFGTKNDAFCSYGERRNNDSR